MRALRCVLTGVLFGCFVSACHTRGGLHLLAQSPTGEVTTALDELTLRFDKPIATDAQVGNDAPDGLLRIVPTLLGSARFADRQTLIFHATQKLNRSTRYQVFVGSQLHAQDGTTLDKDLAFEFTTERMKIVKLTATDPLDSLALLPAFRLRTTQPFAPRVAAKECWLETLDKRKLLLRATAETDVESGTQSAQLVPFAPLDRDTAYTFTCSANFHGSEGELGMIEPFTAATRSYGNFAVVSTSPRGPSVDIENQAIEIRFSNPVDLNQVRKAISATPPIHDLDSGYMSDPRVYRTNVLLTPQTEYTITIKGSLADHYAQTLGQDMGFSFHSGDSKPVLSIHTGEFVVESSWPRYAMFTRNVSRLNVEAVKIPDARLAEVTLAGVPYDYYDEAAGDKHWLRKLKLAAQSHTIAISGTKNKWQAGTLEVNKLAGSTSTSGLYAIEVVAPETPKAQPRRMLLNVTDIGLVAKLGITSGLVWAVHLSDGKPAMGVKITLVNGKGKTRFSGVTDAQGVVLVPGSQSLFDAIKSGAPRDEDYAEERGGGSARDLVIIGRENADTAVLSGAWQDGIALWNFNLKEGQQQAARLRGFMHTDRGLYRPGETVHVKGLARLVESGSGLRLPDEKQAEVVVTDARGSEIKRVTLPLSAFGSFTFDLPLTAEARVGQYQVEATMGDKQKEKFTDSFLVAEYRPALFEAKLEAAHASYQLGDTISAKLKADYLYGAPLAHGKATYTVRRREFVPSFPQFEGFRFADFNALYDHGEWWNRYDENANSFEVANDETQLNDKGELTIKIPTKDLSRELKGSQELVIEATVSDESNQSVSASRTITAHRSPFYLGVRPVDEMPAANKPFKVQLLAVDTEGKPRAQKAELVATLVTWNCHYDGAGYYSSYRCDKKEDEFSRQSVALVGSGPVDVMVKTPQPGEVRLTLRAVDQNGHDVVASEQIWAWGDGVASFRDNDEARMMLKASKSRYKRGETARLMAQTTVKNATALVTVEREGVLRYFVQPFKSAGQAFEIPLVDADVPNVYVSVTLVRGRTGDKQENSPIFRMGMTGFDVDADHKRLAVKVTTDKPNYRPGEKANAHIEVHDVDGKPVRAEVAISVADEGVLQLIAYKTPDPQASFYAAVRLGVENATNWNRLAKRIDPNALNEDGEAGDMSDNTNGVRKKFLSTAFWAPQLVTADDGTADVSFELPDNLTAFRVMAMVADVKDRFGSSDVRLTVSKPLQAMPAMPRFVNVGDRFEAGAVLHNHTGQSGSAKVDVEMTGLQLKGANSQSVKLQNDQSRAVHFNLHATHEGLATALYRASMGDEKDAVQISLPVNLPQEAITSSLSSGDLLASATLTPQMSWPKETMKDGTVELQLDPYGMVGLDESMRYLVEYPYGCLEQTTSRVIPMVMLEGLVNTLKLESLQGTKLKEYVRAGIAKVLRHQHENGAFSLWPDSEPELFLTSYALFGLHIDEVGGYAVDKAAIEAGVRSLREGLAAGSNMGMSDNFLGEAGSRAFALFVLSEYKQLDPVAMNKLYEERKSLPIFGKALLARTMKRGKADQKQMDTIWSEVMAAAKPVAGHPDELTIAEPNEGSLWYYFSSSTRTSALALSALLELDPKSADVPRLVKGLLNSRQDDRWDNTQDNLFSLVALGEYAQLKKKDIKDGKGSVRIILDGKVIAEKKGTRATQTIHLPLDVLKKGKLELVSTLPFSIAYDARLRYRRELSSVAQESKGFVVSRRLEDPKDGTLRANIRVGDLVRVVVDVTPAAKSERVAIVDRLPAGLEPAFVDVRRPTADSESDDEYHHDSWVWVGKEIYDDRVAVFADHLWQGEHYHFTYLARATTAGDFLHPNASAEEMYRPQHHGTSASGRLTIEEAK